MINHENNLLAGLDHMAFGIGRNMAEINPFSVGYLANEMLRRIHFDKVFLAASVEANLGVTTPNSMEAVQIKNVRILLMRTFLIGEKAICLCTNLLQSAEKMP
jgi:DeoR/GlpR family transcriptional regulator of sugar metabolism